MVETLRELLRVQQTDIQIEETEKQIAEIPKQRARIRDRHERAQANLEAARALLQDEQREERRLETELSDKEALCQKLESQSYEVTSNQAYRAILHEIDEARTYISKHETAALERMEAIEEAERALDVREAEATDIEREAILRQSELDTEEQRLRDELARLLEVAKNQAARVEPALLKRYQAIKQRRTPAIAVMAPRGTSCPKCRIELPPQVALNLRNGEDMVTCHNCDRILVGPHVMETASEN